MYLRDNLYVHPKFELMCKFFCKETILVANIFGHCYNLYNQGFLFNKWENVFIKHWGLV